MAFPPPPLPADAPVSELLIVLLAVPALAGPSALATVMLLVSQAPERRWEWVAALCVTMAVCAVLLLAERLQRVVGLRVLLAFERLMGLILVALSVEMLLRAVRELARQSASSVSFTAPAARGTPAPAPPPPAPGPAAPAAPCGCPAATSRAAPCRPAPGRTGW